MLQNYLITFAITKALLLPRIAIPRFVLSLWPLGLLFTFRDDNVLVVVGVVFCFLVMELVWGTLHLRVCFVSCLLITIGWSWFTIESRAGYITPYADLIPCAL